LEDKRQQKQALRSLFASVQFSFFAVPPRFSLPTAQPPSKGEFGVQDEHNFGAMLILSAISTL